MNELTRSALGLCLGLALLGASVPASAQDSKQVALLPVRGLAIEDVAIALVEGMPAGYVLVPQKQTNYVVNRSTHPVSAGDYSMVARRLKASALIEARTSIDAGWKMRLGVRKGATGAVIGSVDFKGANKTLLLASIRRRGPLWLKALIDRASADGGQAVAAAPAPQREQEQEQTSAPAAQSDDGENPLDRRPLTRAALVERQQRTIARREREAEEEAMDARPAPARRSGSLQDEPEEELAAQESARDLEASPMWELSVGPRMMSRAFIFTDNVTGLPGFNLPAAPGIYGEAELFPAARSRGPTKNFGFAGQWETSVGAKTTGRDGNRSVTTKAQSYRVGPRYRFLTPAFNVTLGADYGEHKFNLDVDDVIPPNVTYTMFRPSVAGRLHVASGISLQLTAAYLHILEVGGLGDKERFPNVTAKGAEVGATLGYEVGPDFELRLQADLRHYAHNFHVKPGDPFVVGGAVDEHFGAALLLTYRMR